MQSSLLRLILGSCESCACEELAANPSLSADTRFLFFVSVLREIAASSAAAVEASAARTGDEPAQCSEPPTFTTDHFQRALWDRFLVPELTPLLLPAAGSPRHMVVWATTLLEHTVLGSVTRLELQARQNIPSATHTVDWLLTELVAFVLDADGSGEVPVDGDLDSNNSRCPTPRPPCLFDEILKRICGADGDEAAATLGLVSALLATGRQAVWNQLVLNQLYHTRKVRCPRVEAAKLQLLILSCYPHLHLSG